MNDLRNIGDKCGTDKIRFGYLDVYHEYFSKFRDEEINILEIGVYNGASVKMWREYFPKANVIGMDVDQKENIFYFLGGKNRFFLGDQGNPLHLELMVSTIKKETNRGFDIVVDDGSHFQYDMMFSLGNLFPHMNSSGVYVVEDMCTETGLNSGSCWWGSPDENHATNHLPGLSNSIFMNKEWLPNGKKDTFYCAETTMKRFEETGVFTSAFLEDEQCDYITKNFSSVKFYKAKVPPITGTSSIALVTKK